MRTDLQDAVCTCVRHILEVRTHETIEEDEPLVVMVK
jgi:hypothetical protein